MKGENGTLFWYQEPITGVLLYLMEFSGNAKFRCAAGPGSRQDIAKISALNGFLRRLSHLIGARPQSMGPTGSCQDQIFSLVSTQNSTTTRHMVLVDSGAPSVAYSA